MNKQITILIGCPGSGKSTWTATAGEGSLVVSRDIIRYSLGYVNDPDQKVLLGKDQEAAVTKAWWAAINAYKQGKGVFGKASGLIIDDTNTNKLFFDQTLKKLIEIFGKGSIQAVKVITSLQTCIRRREGQIPADIVKNMWESAKKINPEDYGIKTVMVRGE